MCCNDDPPKVMPDWKKVFVSREEFLKVVCLATGAVIGAIAVVPPVAFILNYFFVKEPREWVRVGPVASFPEDQTVNITFDDPYCLPWDGVSKRRTAWLRRTNEDQFVAFAINCTHLGCPVRWEKGAELFMCPCHGGVFYSDGEVAGGPPPRPLHQYPTRVVDGDLEIKAGPVLTRKT